MTTYLGAIGIGVNDLDKSEKFYSELLGMDSLQTIETPIMNEIIMGYKGSQSAAVVLMNYTDGSNPNYSNNPVKLVFTVSDCEGALKKIADAGHTIVSAAKPYPSMGGVIIGFAKDPDGYLIEFFQKPSKA